MPQIAATRNGEKARKLDSVGVKRWRVAFYLVMACNWYGIYLHQAQFDNPFERAMGYSHTEWVLRMAPTSDVVKKVYRYGGTALALLSMYSDFCTILFAIITSQYVLTTVTCFVNHDYLFALLSTLMSFYCNSKTLKCKMGWFHALRGQIVVVYAFASVWKLHPDWLSGEIVQQIFLSFEKQGVNRGVPWKAIHEAFPDVFQLVALSGILLDAALFFVLFLLPPGHRLQHISLLFHGFTGFTMSQRIGYAFPLAMTSTGFLFMPNEHEAPLQSHANWLMDQLIKPKKHNILPLVWLLIQWTLPLRMPLISGFNFKYTREGYRWSWTMMLHSANSFVQPGLSLMTLRPTCSGNPFPNPMKTPFVDVQSFSYEQLLSPRGVQAVQLFPRQLPHVANQVHRTLSNARACRKDLKISASLFSSANNGPYHRIVDPAVDLVSTYRALASRPYMEKLRLALIDKVPRGHEFILRGIASARIPPELLQEEGMIGIVDRTACLVRDPIRIHNVNFVFEVIESKYPILLRACEDLELKSCKEVTVEKGSPVSVPAIRTLAIGFDPSVSLYERSCSDTLEEDVVLRLRPYPNNPMNPTNVG